MKEVKDMTGYEVREELREFAKPRLAQEKKNREAFLRALRPTKAEGEICLNTMA